MFIFQVLFQKRTLRALRKLIGPTIHHRPSLQLKVHFQEAWIVYTKAPHFSEAAQKKKSIQVGNQTVE